MQSNRHLHLPPSFWIIAQHFIGGSHEEKHVERSVTTVQPRKNSEININAQHRTEALLFRLYM